MERTTWNEAAEELYNISIDIDGLGDLIFSLESYYKNTECTNGIGFIARLLWDYAKRIKQCSDMKFKEITD